MVSYVLSSAQDFIHCRLPLSFTQTSNTFTIICLRFLFINLGDGDTLTTDYAIYPTGNVTTVRIILGNKCGNTYTDLPN